jgi:cysteine desulfurase
MPLHRIYLDHAATTPVRPEVREAMLPFLGEEAFGNPSSGHHFGRAARAGLEAARKRVADALGAQMREVFFTSGGTEADNQAILGCIIAHHGTDLSRAHVVTTSLEHKAILAACHEAERLGARVTILRVNAHGVVDLDQLRSLLDGGSEAGVPCLVSVMWVNNETGVVQPMAEIAGLCAAAGVTLHTDAVQAFGKIPVRLPDHPGIAMLSISAHKIGGPKGIGALIVRHGEGIHPLLHGGGQQRGLRPGTENVPGAVALGTACELAAAEQPGSSARVRAIRDAVEQALLERVQEAVVHSGGAPRGPNILSISAPDTDSETMLMHLDLAGLACASGSACSTGSVSASHVLRAMGVPEGLAAAAVRLSFGALSSPDDVQRIADTWASVVEKVRHLRAVLARA